MIGIGQFDVVCSVSIILVLLWVFLVEVVEILCCELSVCDVIFVVMVVDVVVVGIGVIDQWCDVIILCFGYISEGEQLMYVCKGVVGDILGYFLQVDGRLVEGLEIYWELFGVIFDELVQLLIIVGVVGGEEKVQVIYVVLIGKCINGLVMEEIIVCVVFVLVF